MPELKLLELEDQVKPLLETLELKSYVYGNAIESWKIVARFLWPEGIPVKHYGLASNLARQWDKWVRMARDRDSREDPSEDACGYAIMLMIDRSPEEVDDPSNDCVPGCNTIVKKEG